jgi:hypothetical protein
VLILDREEGPLEVVAEVVQQRLALLAAGMAPVPAAVAEEVQEMGE